MELELLVVRLRRALLRLGFARAEIDARRADPPPGPKPCPFTSRWSPS
jgi:hypothetical protein